ncbi:hypothetical protein [Thermocaproicibacter melissae]|uniref:hypothetical protein n=1 Tax=Thermocaproicibacter melissae TaxID=2966552 RepID=UPI0024B263B9|nr:hypothetical protein [Thermocaproicibacter melissae]WBY64715.1 hypothetical protein NOG13_03185 [Thermocaproicibacter melissae]
MMKSMKKASYILAVAIISVTIGHGIAALTRVSAVPMSTSTELSDAGSSGLNSLGTVNTNESEAVKITNDHNSSSFSISAVSEYSPGMAISSSRTTSVSSGTKSVATSNFTTNSRASSAKVSVNNSAASTTARTKKDNSANSTKSSTTKSSSTTSTKSTTKKNNSAASTQSSTKATSSIGKIINSDDSTDLNDRVVSASDTHKVEAPYDINAIRNELISYGESKGLYYNPNLQIEDCGYEFPIDILQDTLDESDFIQKAKQAIDSLIKNRKAEGADFNPVFVKKSNKVNDYWVYELYK